MRVRHHPTATYRHPDYLPSFGIFSLAVLLTATSCGPSNQESLTFEKAQPINASQVEESAPEPVDPPENQPFAELKPPPREVADVEKSEGATEAGTTNPLEKRKAPELTASFAASISSKADLTPEMKEALQSVNAQCPEAYQETVTPLPEEGRFDEIATSELLTMLENWNPSLRKSAANALGNRGDQAIPALIKASRSNQGSVRAGAATAVAAIIKKMLNNWQDHEPGAKNWREAHDQIRADHAHLADLFIRLAGDPELEVRVAAMQGMEVLLPQTPEAVEAVLKLCLDENEYLAQSAMVAINRNFSLEPIPEERVIQVIKETMQSPLPNGRGHIVQAIAKMDEPMQRQFIPDLLAHLDWRPIRDTMFAAGGQAGAIEILTKLGVKELIPRLPTLMTKSMRGPGLFMPCLEAAQKFGKDAKVILPELKAKLAESEQGDAKKRQDHEERVKKLKETIAFLEKQ